MKIATLLMAAAVALTSLAMTAPSVAAECQTGCCEDAGDYELGGIGCRMGDHADGSYERCIVWFHNECRVWNEY